MQHTTIVYVTGPDDTGDELNFSVFMSSDFWYDDIADFSLTLENSDEEVVINISNACEVGEYSIAQFAERGCTYKHFDVDHVAGCSLWTTVGRYRELIHSELDLVVMGQLLAAGQEAHTKGMWKSFTHFQHGGHTTFCYLHTTGQPQVQGN